MWCFLNSQILEYFRITWLDQLRSWSESAWSRAASRPADRTSGSLIVRENTEEVDAAVVFVSQGTSRPWRNKLLVYFQSCHLLFIPQQLLRHVNSTRRASIKYWHSSCCMTVVLVRMQTLHTCDESTSKKLSFWQSAGVIPNSSSSL